MLCYRTIHAQGGVCRLCRHPSIYILVFICPLFCQGLSHLVSSVSCYVGQSMMWDLRGFQTMALVPFPTLVLDPHHHNTWAPKVWAPPRWDWSGLPHVVSLGALKNLTFSISALPFTFHLLSSFPAFAEISHLLKSLYHSVCSWAYIPFYFLFGIFSDTSGEKGGRDMWIRRYV